MITLTAVSYDNQTPFTPLSATFDGDGGTLGRSKDNYFVLPDSKNLVSRIQALIKSDDVRHTITNLSKTNPVMLNGKELECDQEQLFNAGDEMQIGPYVLRAEVCLETDGTSNHSAPDQTGMSGTPKLRWGKSLTDAPEVAYQTASVSSPEAQWMTHSESDELKRPETMDADRTMLLQAFLKGAGISEAAITFNMTPELMEKIGKLLTASLQGTLQLLAARALIRREVKAEVTMVAVRNNNPLKFLPDSETILMQMLRKKMPGFMGPVEAMQDAFADLQAHQTGMAAGMHGAINEVLQRLDPNALEKRILSDNFLVGIFSAKRKAQMWDEFCTIFDDVSKKIEDDYQKFYGEAFLKAYELEIEQSQSRSDTQNA